MAKVVADTYKPKRNRPGPVPKYPWKEWLDGQRRRVEKGVDFVCNVASMADNLRKFAKANGIALAEVHEEPDAVVFRAKVETKKKRSRQ